MISKQISVTACLIVKNEEVNLPRCLDSLRPVVDEIVVVDTGSTDRTVELARELLEDAGYTVKQKWEVGEAADEIVKITDLRNKSGVN